MMNHTPTPYSYDGDQTITDSLGFHVAFVNEYASSFGDGKHEANAAFIVRAVNSHAALVEALSILVNQYDASGDFTMGGKLTNDGFLKGRSALALASL